MNCPTHLAILCQTFVAILPRTMPLMGPVACSAGSSTAASRLAFRSETTANQRMAPSRAPTFVGSGGKVFTSAPTARFCTPAAACTTAGRCSIALPRSTAMFVLCKMQCCPKEPSREIPRVLHERARDVARRLIRKKAFLEIRATSAGASRCASPI